VPSERTIQLVEALQAHEAALEAAGKRAEWTELLVYLDRVENFCMALEESR
jgi:enamine deaminase RidA (YjgF/YER057c/UK114 family)